MLSGLEILKVMSKLVKQLVKRDIFVLNLGCPLLPLNIEDDLYYELDHNMFFEHELALCELANACIMTAEAGMFVGFAASNINIIQIDEELHPQLKVIDLFRARRNIGIDDLDVRPYVTKEDYLGAADYIEAKIGGLRRLVAGPNLQPKIVYL